MSEQLFLPYRFGRHAVAVQMQELEVDGERADRRIDAGRRSIALYGLEGWREAAVRVEAAVQRERLAALLPPDEVDDPPCTALLVVRCDATRWRRSWRLEPAPGGCGWRGELRIPRREILGAATAEVLLVRDSDRPGLPRQLASRRNLRLASSEEWRLLFDQSRAPSDGFLSVVWEDFASSPAARRRLFPSAAYDVDTAGDPPVLYLNAGIPGLQGLVSSEAPTGLPAAVRDLLCDFIAQGAWTALASAAGVGGASPPPAAAGWKRSVTAALQPRLDERARSFGRSAAGELLLSAVQAEIPLERSIAALVGELGRHDG